MNRDSQQDPETAWIWRRSAPIPRIAIVSGEAGVVKTSLRRAPNGCGLDNPRRPAKPTQTGKGEWDLLDVGGGRLASAVAAVLPLVGYVAQRFGLQKLNIFIEISLDRGWPSHRRR